MKKFLILTVLVLLLVGTQAQKFEVNDINLGDIVSGFIKTASSHQSGNISESKGDCLNVAFDLISFLYEELQAFINTSQVPDQMTLMMKGMTAMTKFTAAKTACLGQ
eukprot:CAMPEP_0196997920 /NCGR_PEP_ID=MMETSP1380-20130617/3422_1 /TAXON_ID=5936 /ORGANISM="Euplotes crassus, Strain CT5" /LENGTH=106 /DNA_ID=CAMNT_0042414309 /DNA_START=23 /DNA_END=343 /DNA_ORIENTATION=+